MSNDLNARTRDYYDDYIREVGAAYEKRRWHSGPVQRSHYRQTRRAITKFLTSKVGRVPRLLEIGSGPGVWSRMCRAHSNDVTLMDISSEMLRVARQNLGDDGFHYVCRDLLEEGPAPGGKYDAVFSSRAIEYMRDKRDAVRRIKSVLNSSGVAGVITKNPKWADKVADDAAGATDADNIQLDWIDWEDLAALFRDEGFVGVGVWPVAFGSYKGWRGTRLGCLWSDASHLLRNGHEMRRSWDAATESYLVLGSLS